MLDQDSAHRLRAEPQAGYTDEALLEREQRAIFDRDWVVVTRAGRLPNPGDYVTATLGRRPIVVIRQPDGRIAAFANFCLHRYAKLLDGTGTARRIVCPYHAWTYDLSGRLIGVADREGFCTLETRDLTLEPLACEIWEGFVFVSRRHDLEPVAARLAPLAARLRPYGMGDYQDRHAVDVEIWDGNWKAVVENFVESYHVTYSHKGSIGPTNPTACAERGPAEVHPWHSLHSNSYRPEMVPDQPNPALAPEDRRKLHVIGLYPNGVAALDGNFMWWMVMEPQGAGRTNARWGASFSPAALAGLADPEGFAAAVVRTLEIATEEDKEMVARVQAGAAYGSERRGFLHDWLEAYVAEFRQYVARMCDAA